MATTVFRPMKAGEEISVVDLVMNVFNEFVAPLFPQEGIAEFKKFVYADAMAERLRAGNIIMLAETDQQIVGIIEIRENNHIALLFVERSHQNLGIAKELIGRSIEICRKRKLDIKRITVNSSPNAIKIYEKIGFKSIEDEKVKNGIRFMPMEFLFENNDGSQKTSPGNSQG
jgi:GNAT superfamily N-acetyltransferase